MDPREQLRPSPWPHRLAVALALVTFPLIWVGGLVTTYDAGMAVPDWPGTYGYNLLLYPWQTWVAGPWDLFIEHGHRLLATLAGLIAIALVVSTLLANRRSWLVTAACGALGLVILQGVLGGMRVLFDERLVALVHACLGPLFFAYVGALAASTSRWWNEANVVETPAGRRLLKVAAITAGLAYGQLILGAILRHVPLTASPQVFRAALVLHLLVAAALAAHIGLLTWRCWSSRKQRGLLFPGLVLPALAAAQISLGLATYVAKYSWPSWLGDYAFAASYVVQEKSLTQSLITTGHVAGGSLILFTAVVLVTRCARLASQAATNGSPLALMTATAACGVEWRAA